MTAFKTKSIIFDMDGTIVDNMNVHLDTWITFLAEHGIHMTLEELLDNNKGNLSEIVSRIFGLDQNDPEVQRIGQAKEKFYRETYAPQLKEIPGLKHTLQQLESSGISCALATNGDQPNIDLVVDGLQIRPYFKTIIGGHQVNNGKPNPEIFLKTLDALDREPEACIVLEDSLIGVEAALNAGIPVIGVTTSHSSFELIGAGCNGTLENYLNGSLFEFI